jgi:hypothetical protein
MWSSRWNENWQGKRKYPEKNCPNATLSTTNPTQSELGTNTGRSDEKAATNRLSYGTAFEVPYSNSSKPSSFNLNVTKLMVNLHKDLHAFLNGTLSTVCSLLILM